MLENRDNSEGISSGIQTGMIPMVDIHNKAKKIRSRDCRRKGLWHWDVVGRLGSTSRPEPSSTNNHSTRPAEPTVYDVHARKIGHITVLLVLARGLRVCVCGRESHGRKPEQYAGSMPHWTLGKRNDEHVPGVQSDNPPAASPNSKPSFPSAVFLPQVSQYRDSYGLGNVGRVLLAGD